MSFSKVLLVLAFATVVSARVLKSTFPKPPLANPILVFNNCDTPVTVDIYHNVDTSCESYRADVNSTTGDNWVKLWGISDTPQYLKFDEPVFIGLGGRGPATTSHKCELDLYEITENELSLCL
jgi:hypothetical protein